MERTARPRPAIAIAIAIFVGDIAWFGLTAGGSLGSSLFWVLSGAAVIAALMTTRIDGTLVISATFAMSMLAIAFLSPAAAFAIVVIAEGAEWLVERYRGSGLAINTRRQAVRPI